MQTLPSVFVGAREPCDAGFETVQAQQACTQTQL